VALMGAAAVIMLARNRVEVVPATKICRLSQIVAGRMSVDVPLSAEVLESLGPGQFLMREYRGMVNEAPMNLYIAFFSRVSARATRFIRRAIACQGQAGFPPSLDES